MSEITGVILPVSINDLKSLIASAVADGIHSNSTDKISEDQEGGFLDVKQAAEYLKLAVPTLYGLTSNKKIPFYKPGKKLFFKRSDLEALRIRGKSVVEPESDERSCKESRMPCQSTE